MSSFIASCSASLSRLLAIANKELIQMRRDRMTFAMMIGVPLMQLMLFGYAINTDPKQLPTVVVAHEQSPLVRTILQGLQNSGYYKLEHNVADYAQADALLAKGEVSFVITIPSGFTRKLIKGERPQLLIEADASDPAASSNAISRAQTIIDSALRHELKGSLSELNAGLSPVDLVIQRRYNPQGLTQYNIVPGLLGVIITMTMVMITGMAMTREVEQGTIENLLAMPAKPLEVMIGKITPYVGVGAVQTLIILLAARYLFDVPFTGSLWLLLAAVALFIIANLALGFTFSTLAKSQMQAMQLTFFFFLPSLLLSGFMFPFRGMPHWAQWIGEVLPLTHFLRIVRGVMLKTADFNSIKYELAAILAFTLVVGVIAMARYKRTLD
ncbi:MAG: ABC transporter permease [Paraglaciecola sp.]|uniref:ABC transporter permease n=1 Tax=Paraglaciecola sp. TaxID=1920173 RepID=UPI00273F1B52|nr:ABC transporter permease [Paraglaciecola sp.]MDP5030519.1 ABC transporter permease [Paraglaciecola sp.]MDP5129577.1 ABC transporter permease [Paraglaciecola sp.]